MDVEFDISDNDGLLSWWNVDMNLEVPWQRIGSGLEVDLSCHCHVVFACVYHKIYTNIIEPLVWQLSPVSVLILTTGYSDYHGNSQHMLRPLLHPEHQYHYSLHE